MSAPQTIAVTGAGGFIGGHLCAALEAAGRGVIRLGRGVPAGDSARRTDYSRASLADALQGADAVVHLAGRRMTRDDAAMDLAPFWQPNVAMMAALVGAARDAGARRLVLASTIAVYGPGSGLPYRETAQPRPLNAYALSKLMAEQHLEMLTRGGAMTALSLRLAAVYGQGEKGTPALMKFARQAQRGETITLTGNPGYVIDQLYVADAARALIAALDSDATGVCNIGGGVPWTVAQIARAANAAFGNPRPLDMQTDSNAPLRGDSDAPLPRTIMDIVRARDTLGWRPAFDLDAGLADMAAADAKDTPC